MNLSNIPWLRKPALFLLKHASFDISIRNPWNRERRLALNIYRHKGYWYHGKSREHETMLRFAKLIRPGDTVFEIGGHIGFIAQYFSKLVGGDGRCVVFEPGENNLPYLERNIGALRNVQLEKCAVADASGKTSFFIEDITGQNNSLSAEYDVFYTNRAFAYSDASYRQTSVDCVTLDEFVAASGKAPDFVKIDVEGAELRVLSGMRQVLASKRPGLMVEITAHNDAVEALLRGAKYNMSDETGRLLDSLSNFRGNLFCRPNEEAPA